MKCVYVVIEWKLQLIRITVHVYKPYNYVCYGGMGFHLSWLTHHPPSESFVFQSEATSLAEMHRGMMSAEYSLWHDWVRFTNVQG